MVLQWLFSTLPNVVFFSPQVWVFTYISGNSCSLHATGAITIMYTVAYLTVYGLCSLLITTVSTINGIVYIKRNTIGQDRLVLKSMVKFAICLLFGNISSFIGTSIPLLLGTFAPIGNRTRELEEALIYGITHRKVVVSHTNLYLFSYSLGQRVVLVGATSRTRWGNESYSLGQRVVLVRLQLVLVFACNSFSFWLQLVLTYETCESS